MMRLFLGTVVLASALSVQAQDNDSLRMEQLQEVVVQGVMVQKDAPYAVANIGRPELQRFAKTGQELPFLFSGTPGVMAWSENGVGTGTSYLRIRGAGDSRINVTLDGVPLNSPEDQCVFWANMNSYATLLGNVQIQRGVGTSTNGDGAFGGTVALSSKTPAQSPTLELSVSHGSYNTLNLGGAFSTGLLWRHLIFDGAYHETSTDGFVHGTSGRSGSYYGGLTWLGDRFTLRYKNIGNFEKTGQAWNGVTAGDNDMSLMDGTYGMQTGIRGYKDLYDRGLGRYNSLYERLVYADDGSFARDAQGNYLTERYQLSDGSYWDKTTDNFWQNHNILSSVWDISDRWKATATLHYTHGYGYYKEFRYQNKLKKFGLNDDDFRDAQGNKVKRSDFVRKKGLRQDAYGALGNVSYRDDHWDIIGGLSLQRFHGNHFGYVTYVSNDILRQALLADGDYRYYDSDADKTDGNIYVKAAYRLSPYWSVFGDVQYRHVGYKTDGYNDKFVYNTATDRYEKHFLDIDKKYDFLNPKAGFSYSRDNHRVYGSLAWSHREPERNNFTDNGNYPAPKAEQLLDYELGYQYAAPRWHAGINLYHMDYRNQFVQTGQTSDIGEPLTTNIKDSYRTGAELSVGGKPTRWLTLEGNAALSRNKVKDFDEYVEDWDDWDGNPDAALYHCDGNGDEMRVFHYDNSTLAFSPAVLLNGFATISADGFQATWHTGFVSRQQLDNSGSRERSLPSFSTSDLAMSYTLAGNRTLGLREVVFGLNLNNIFNRHYAASGWVYSAIAESYGHTNDNRYYQIGYVPMAGFTMMGSITLRF